MVAGTFGRVTTVGGCLMTQYWTIQSQKLYKTTKTKIPGNNNYDSWLKLQYLNMLNLAKYD